MESLEASLIKSSNLTLNKANQPTIPAILVTPENRVRVKVRLKVRVRVKVFLNGIWLLPQIEPTNTIKNVPEIVVAQFMNFV